MLPGVCCPFLSREKKTEEAINDQQPMTNTNPKNIEMSND